MSKARWLSLANVGLLLSFAVIAPPHTVHHGVDAADTQECPVLTATDQTNAEHPDNLSLTIFLPRTEDLSIFHHILLERPAYQVHRSRAPPFSLPT
ncbi:MAG: hypothetical protein ACE5I9_04690 [Candidatus Methylomirabilales bacterium]